MLSINEKSHNAKINLPLLLLLGSIFVGFSFLVSNFLQSDPPRDPKWAVPIKDKPGLPNLHKITDNLYRGAQPTVEGFKELKKMGIKTVINLRSAHSDRDEMEEAGVTFQYVHISFKTCHAEDKDVKQFLDVIQNKDNYPIFFHCQHGADRTGMMCAIYRMVEQDWTNEEALKEMVEGGYGFHSIWINIKRYVKNFDAKKFKKPK